MDKLDSLCRRCKWWILSTKKAGPMQAVEGWCRPEDQPPEYKSETLFEGWHTCHNGYFKLKLL